MPPLWSGPPIRWSELGREQRKAPQRRRSSTSDYDRRDIVDHCCDAGNRLIDQPWIMSIGLRDWANASNATMIRRIMDGGGIHRDDVGAVGGFRRAAADGPRRRYSEHRSAVDHARARN